MTLGRTADNKIKIKTDSPKGLRAVECACCESCCISTNISPALLEEIKNANFVRIQMLISYNEANGDFYILAGTDDIDITLPWDGVGNFLIEKYPNYCSSPMEPPFATAQADRAYRDVDGNIVAYEEYAFYLGLQDSCLQFYYGDLSARYSFGGLGLAGTGSLWPNKIDEPDNYATNFITVNDRQLNAFVPSKMTRLIDFQTCEEQNFENCIEFLHAVNSASITLTFS